MPVPCIDHKSFLFNIFGNCSCHFILPIIFQVSDGKYQNILSTRIYANSPCCKTDNSKGDTAMRKSVPTTKTMVTHGNRC